MHYALAETSPIEDYNEKIVSWSGVLYNCANLEESYRVAHLDFPTPADMRAPGATTGVWANETAMDELSYKLKIDPLELRLKNYAYDDRAQASRFRVRN